MEDAARIDGCGYVKTWQKVIFPMARPGIMTAGVLAFLNNWNEYYWASLVLIDREKTDSAGIVIYIYNIIPDKL